MNEQQFVRIWGCNYCGYSTHLPGNIDDHQRNVHPKQSPFWAPIQHVPNLTIEEEPS